MRLRSIALAAILALLLLASTASASPAWTPSIAFPVPGNVFEGQDVVRYQDGGIATEAFVEVDSLMPLRTVLHVGTLAPGGSYSEQLTIPSSEEAVPESVHLAVTPDGAAVVTWVELTGPDPNTFPFRYRAAYRPAGSNNWGAPVTIHTDSTLAEGYQEKLTPVIALNGMAAVALEHVASGEEGPEQHEPVYRVDVAIHPAPGAWQDPERITPLSRSARSLVLGMDAQGDITAAYALRFNEGNTVGPLDDHLALVVQEHVASTGVWGPEQDITGSHSEWNVSPARLGENEAGDATVAFQYSNEVGKEITLDVAAVTRQGTGGQWSTPATLPEGIYDPEEVGVAPNGTSYVLYSAEFEKGTKSCVGVIRAPFGGPVGSDQCVSQDGEDTFSGSIAFLANDAYFAWKRNITSLGSDVTIDASRWPDTSPTPEAAQALDAIGAPSVEVSYGDPTLVNDRQGSIAALYTNPAKQLRAAAYDAGPPILLGSSVPTSATATQPVAFSASYIDLWSGLATSQPTWSFGDGTPTVSGANTTHTFTDAGTYTVSLNAADAFANTTATTYTITVQPAATFDTSRPKVTLDRPVCHKRSRKGCSRFWTSRGAWQTLQGHVSESAPSSGIATVQVAIYRILGKHAEALSHGHFHKTTRGKARKTFNTANLNGSHWSLPLPKLKAGQYTILVRATDHAGHLSAMITKTLRLR
jgi:PKD repeat protein